MAEFIAMIDSHIGPVSIHVDAKIIAAGEPGDTPEALYAGALIGFLRSHVEAGIALARLVNGPPFDNGHSQRSLFDDADHGPDDDRGSG